MTRSHQTRISADVWEIAEEVCNRMKMANPRQAIESIIRMYADSYPNGSPQVAQSVSKAQKVDVAKALDDVIRGLQ